MKNILNKKSLLYLLYLCITVVVCLELLLHIYNPFHFRLKGNQIVLETNKAYHIDNSRIPVLDKSITHTKNSLGFRGPEKPGSPGHLLSILTIGGSTTECAYLGDSKTWPQILYQKLHQTNQDIWLNNAGMAGHSTFGHIALMKDHVLTLKPSFVLLLVGANEIGRGKIPDNHSPRAFLARNSELINVVVNLLRTREAKQRNLTDTYINLKKSDSLVLSDSTIAARVLNETDGTDQYRARLTTLLNICSQNNIRPVLITQPSMMGIGKDPLTGVSLETIKLSSNQNGKLWWMILERYNDVTRQVAAERNLPIVDLAHLLPKSSEYFYDVVHFTNTGSARTASILYDSLLHVLH